MKLFLICPNCKERGAMSATEQVFVQVDKVTGKKVGETRIAITKCDNCGYQIGPKIGHGDTAVMSKN